MPTKRVVVAGHVQRVGFRQYVQTVADDLHIHGEVWNRSDGAVELIAHSDCDSALDKLEILLHQGPGRVDSVTVSAEPDQDFFGFRIDVSR